MAAVRDCCLLLLVVVAVVLLSATGGEAAVSAVPGDAAAMRALSAAVGGSAALGWSDSADPCSAWPGVGCAGGRVERVQIGRRGLSGVLPQEIANLTALIRLEVMNNSLSGPIPSLAGLSSLQILLLNRNAFTSVPSDFFSGLTSLLAVSLDDNPFEKWSIPASLAEAAGLVNFSATNANITGGIPEFFATSFPGLQRLSLSYNKLEGGIPPAFSGSPVSVLWLNGQANRALSGGIDVIANMTNLRQLWLQTNSFSGPIPDLSRLDSLSDFNLRDNQLTGPVPSSLINLKSLTSVSLTNNLLQGPFPEFPDSVKVKDVEPRSESFCLNETGVECDPRVNVLLSIAGSFGYPARFAQNWKGNDPCGGWLGIACDASGNITVVNFQSMGLNGTISPDFQKLPELQKLLLYNNNLTGTIPQELTRLASLKVLDVSRNALWGKVPVFDSRVTVKTDGNPDIGKDGPPSPIPGSSGSGKGGHDSNTPGGSDGGKNSAPVKVIVGSVVGAAGVAAAIGMLGFCYCKRRKHHIGWKQRPTGIVIHPQHSGSDADMMKISLAGAGLSGVTGTTDSQTSSGPGDLRVIEAGNMMTSIQVLRDVTNNFDEGKILGRGGFGTVYEGELHNGSLIAVKRMEGGTMGSKGLHEFRSEISVLTRVRHRHLVSLLGYCWEDNERILVYEHMPQGTLSDHLFDWMKAGLRPLGWSRRLIIALDVARGVEYLHSLANQSFIHRDLKPSNILLGDNMRAKVADFGLVRLAPEGKYSVETRLAGTFGYLAPEYAATGRVTTKVDVYSFGVILMELITGRKALDDNQPDDSVHLVTWFRRMLTNKNTFPKAIDAAIKLDEETLASITTVAELAGHCTAREPYQRPEMGHAVNVLSSLAEEWTPSGPCLEDDYGLDLNMTLQEAVKKWQELTGSTQMEGTNSTSYLASMDNSLSSIPRPTGFAESFTSADGR